MAASDTHVRRTSDSKIALAINHNTAIESVRPAQNGILADCAIARHKFHFKAADCKPSR